MREIVNHDISTEDFSDTEFQKCLNTYASALTLMGTDLVGFLHFLMSPELTEEERMTWVANVFDVEHRKLQYILAKQGDAIYKDIIDGKIPIKEELSGMPDEDLHAALVPYPMEDNEMTDDDLYKGFIPATYDDIRNIGEKKVIQ